MKISNLVDKVIKNSNPSLIDNVKDRDQNAMLELVAQARVESLARFDAKDIESEIRDQLNIESDEDLTNKNKTKHFFGLPVVNDDGDRLAFQNPKNDTIHICRTGDPPENRNRTYGWSECGFGSSRGKSQSNAIYVSDNEIDKEYITRNNNIIGKICGNCRKSY